MARTPILPVRIDDATKARWRAAAAGESLALAEFVRVAVEEKIAGGAAPATSPRPLEARGGKVFSGPDPKPKDRDRR